MSSTLSALNELIKHECKVFPSSLIIIALLLHLRIQLNLILGINMLTVTLEEVHKHLDV